MRKLFEAECGDARKGRVGAAEVGGPLGGRVASGEDGAVGEVFVAGAVVAGVPGFDALPVRGGIADGILPPGEARFPVGGAVAEVLFQRAHLAAEGFDLLELIGEIDDA